MQEIIVPPAVIIPEESNTTTLLERHATSGADPVLFAVLDAAGTWQDIRATVFRADVVALAKGLIAQGIQAGDRVAIMSRTRYEWTLVDFALWYAGAISVPVYETSAPSQVSWNLSNSSAVAAFGEFESHLATLRQASESEGLGLAHFWNLSTGLDELRAAGREVDDDQLEQRRSRAGLRDVATIIYTSGTTGRPKGVELTHGNFVELSENALAELRTVVGAPGAQTIMFLPLAHIFGRFIAILNVAAGARTGHTPDIKNLLADFQSFNPTYILAVPRVFEKVYNSAALKAESEGKGKIFEKAAETAIAYSRAAMEGSPSVGLRAKHWVFDKLVYGKLRAAMGGRLNYAVSGGGPLGERLGHFFNGIGVTVLEGYGLTETTAPISVNQPRQIKIGTVGRPLPGNAVRIAADGEILSKGACVMKGYHERADLTEEAFTDGWFHTGDIGELDEDGFLRITGRKKEILVTAGGKNVAPAQLEDQIRSSALVSQCMVIGDGKPFIAALITLDEEALPQWAAHHGLPRDMTVLEASRHPVIRDAVQKVVDHANESVSHAEAIKSFRIVASDFTEATGHLTPSLKIKRAQILRDFTDVVEEIYSAAKPS
ncbi:AMP-dependent synthetase/ligase [Psychromicrobium xiongbiense]|uniref:AMP-dependent synthetase/ligase n=1 Tax=Psychromicrobium xiongbiense TaxID=3051184 RepID=UPI002553BB75|nr:AMP-dependent synthetase/ligase [Psychromicrobium sp. YIM S02556]